jgi:hypothetical protein
MRGESRSRPPRGWQRSSRNTWAATQTKRDDITREREADVLRLGSKLKQAERKLKRLSRRRISTGQEARRATHKG